MADQTYERLPSDAYAPRKDLAYVDVGNLHPLFDKIAFHSNTILSGPKGVGKSLSIAAWAAKNNVPVVTADCSEDMRRSHLLGTFVLRGDNTPFVLGPLTTAFEVANEIGSCVLILEEVNALTPQMQKLLNAIADWRRRLEVPEAGKVFQLQPEKRLWITGTMNTAVYGGVYQLNEDLKSRFDLLPVDYPAEADETKILVATTAAEPALVAQLLQLAKESRQNSVDYALSTRDLVQLAANIKRAGLPAALMMMSGKFEEADRAWFQERVKSIWRITLGSKKK